MATVRKKNVEVVFDEPNPPQTSPYLYDTINKRVVEKNFYAERLLPGEYIVVPLGFQPHDRPKIGLKFKPTVHRFKLGKKECFSEVLEPRQTCKLFDEHNLNGVSGESKASNKNFIALETDNRDLYIDINVRK